MKRFVLVAMVVVGLAIGCKDIEQKAEVAPPAVMVAPAVERMLVDKIEASGELVARARATVASQVDGQVTELGADEGVAVVEGQVVIEIDRERRSLELADAAARLSEAQADLEEGQRERARIAQLHAQKAVSQAQLDGADTQVRLARSRVAAADARLGLARRALADSSVVAPFAGRIERRHVSVGEFVSTGQQLFELVDPDLIEVEFHLAEIDSGRVELGDPVELRVAPFPDRRFRAEASFISPTIDPRSRTLRVKAVVKNHGGVLRPGLFARIELGVSERSGVVMVPEESILQRADGSVLFKLVEENRVRRLPVRTGVQRDGLVEVEGDVGAGEWVVVRGQTDLVDGAVVFLREADGSPVSLSTSDLLEVAPTLTADRGAR